jgi:replicative DNA helicase
MSTKNYKKETQISTPEGYMPPQAKELEQVVLGAIMLEKGAIDEVGGILQPDSFYVDAHKTIFKTIQTLSLKCQPIDIMTVMEQLKADGKLDAIGGSFYVMQLTNSVVSATNIKTHAQIIQEKYLLREQIRIYGNAIIECYQTNADGFDLLDDVSGKLTNLAMIGLKGEAKRIDYLIVERFKRLETLRHRGEGYTGVPSGFHDIDIITGGWQDTDLIIIAARPSVGKTAFALNCARNAAANSLKPTPVLFLSLEMSSGQLADRLLSSESGVELDVITKARANDETMQRLHSRGVLKIADYQLFIDDAPAQTIMDVRAKARKYKSSENIGLIVIDYLQLMNGLTDEKKQNREQEIANISRGLKGLAKELKIPIIALSQLNRDAEIKEPTLANLRESGAIEQDADMVIFLYREDYQKMDSEIDPMLKGLSFVKIAKHRNGALEKIPMNTDLSIQRWMTPTQFRTYQLNQSTNYKNLIPINSLKNTGTDGDYF